MFDKVVNVSKKCYIGGLICIEAVTRTLQNVVSLADFFKQNQHSLSELGVRLLTNLEIEYNSESNPDPDYNELVLR